jgi:ABC-type Zn uptake system ZnuABC Zn-binding protein ZnuA
MTRIYDTIARVPRDRDAGGIDMAGTARGRIRKTIGAVLGAGALALAAAGCGGDDPASAGSGKLEVATTVAPITSIAANIGGDRVDITGIVPEGTNSHTFEPKPSAAELLSKVDVVYVNGLKLEEPTKELADENMKDGAELVELGTGCIDEKDWIYDFSFPRSDGKPNPHLWTDPRFADCYARIVRDDLSERDPDNASYYAANYRKFKTMIGELDEAMRASFATIPKRELLTYHDAYAYFGKDYDWTIIGAIQVSDFEDPTPKEVAGLIRQVRAQKVPAIFGSEVFPSPVLEQIGRETGVEYVDVLRDDDLPGEPGDAEHSWVGLMHFDYVTMTEALGGDASALKAFRVRNVASDRAEYPQ